MTKPSTSTLRLTFPNLITLIGVIATATPARAEETPQFRYENRVSESAGARDLFGNSRDYRAPAHVEMGRFDAGVSTKLDCGRLDINANIHAQLRNIKRQLESMIPKNPDDAKRMASTSLMLTACYAYPTLCAQIRHDFLSLQGNLNLRAQACATIDKHIDNQADKGAMQLRAEAQAHCVSKEMRHGADVASATEHCQSQTGLPMRDFQAGLEKNFKYGKQKVLSAIVGFAREKGSYNFLASMIGEIEVQQDGYWQPLFSDGLLRPSDVAEGFLAQGQKVVCEYLEQLLSPRRSRDDMPYETFLREVARRKLTKTDTENLGDLGTEDRRLACHALGRALGREAADRARARYESTLASGLLNSAIPTALREEYRSRAATAFPAMRAALEAEQIPPVDEVRRAISELAAATREKNRVLASGMSANRIENDRRKTRNRTDCTDTLSCEGGGR